MENLKVKNIGTSEDLKQIIVDVLRNKRSGIRLYFNIRNEPYLFYINSSACERCKLYYRRCYKKGTGISLCSDVLFSTEVRNFLNKIKIVPYRLDLIKINFTSIK